MGKLLTFLWLEVPIGSKGPPDSSRQSQIILKVAVQNLSLIAIGLLAALVVAEGSARLVRPQSTVEYLVDSEVGQILVPDQRERWVSRDFDVEVITNDVGFHDVKHTIDKAEGVYRIVVVGDSYIEGLQVSIEQGFTHQLHRILQQRLTNKVEVINLGIGGTGPSQYYRRLQKIGMAYRPDLVVMAVHPDNDFWDSYKGLSDTGAKPFYSISKDGELQYIPPRPKELQTRMAALARRSALWLLFRTSIANTNFERWLSRNRILAAPGAQTEFAQKAIIPVGWYVFVVQPPDPWPEAYQLTLRMIRESQKLAEQNGAKFLAMLIGSVPMVQSKWKETLSIYPGARHLQFDFDKPFEAILRLGQEVGFNTVNLVDPFQKDYQATGQSSSWAHDGHWTPKGHQLAAEVLSNHILQNLTAYKLNQHL